MAEIVVRLSAMEIFLCHTLSNCLGQAGQSAQIDRIHRDLLQRVDRANMNALSPMYADGDTDDLAYAIRCLISMQRRIMRLPPRV